jgi:acyl-CoA thioester hydrolase
LRSPSGLLRRHGRRWRRYYANYLKFCERARTDWLRAVGFGQQRLAAEQDIVFVVRAVQADYLQAAVLDDQRSHHHPRTLGRASLVFAQKILRGSQVIFEALITIACVGLGSRNGHPDPRCARTVRHPGLIR